MDEAQAEYLVTRYADLLIRIGRTWLEDLDDAKDICQIVLIKLDEGLALTVENPEPEENGLLAQVMALPAKYRQVIFLRYYEGYEVREIAALLGRSPALVSTHLQRGKDKLQIMLGGTEYAR